MGGIIPVTVVNGFAVHPLPRDEIIPTRLKRPAAGRINQPDNYPIVTECFTESIRV